MRLPLKRQFKCWNKMSCTLCYMFLNTFHLQTHSNRSLINLALTVIPALSSWSFTLTSSPLSFRPMGGTSSSGIGTPSSSQMLCNTPVAIMALIAFFSSMVIAPPNNDNI